MDKVSNSGAQRPQPTQEPRPAPRNEQPRPAQRNEQARSYARLSPEKQRADSVARKPRPAVKTLGSRIDVYA